MRQIIRSPIRLNVECLEDRTVPATVQPLGTEDKMAAEFAAMPARVAALEGEAAATVTLSLSNSRPVVGQSVTLTAHVVAAKPDRPVPTGDVSFMDGVIEIGRVTLNASGDATLTTSQLEYGLHNLRAVYHGPGGDVVSESKGLVVSAMARTTTVLRTVPQTAVVGQAVTLTAEVKPAVGSVKPTGTVTFKDGATVLGTSALANGLATFRLPPLSAGTHVLTAEYGGTAQFGLSASMDFSLIVWRAPTDVKLQVSHIAVSSGQEVTLTSAVAVVAPGAGTPTGKVAFFDGSREIGSVSLTNGQAVLRGVKLPPGVRRIMAVYRGDESFRSGNAPPAAITVRTATQTVVTIPPSAYGQTVPLKATVNGLAPGSGRAGGRVTFKDGTRVLGTATVYSGVAHLSVSGLTVGAHSITAVYDGQNEFLASTSAAVAYTVGRGSPSLQFTTVPTDPTSISPVTLRASVAPGRLGAAMPTGQVTFKDGWRVLGTATVTAGVGTLPATLTPGAHMLGAYYSGDANYLPWYMPLPMTLT